MNRPAPWRSIMTSMVDRRPFKVGGATVDPVSRDARWSGGEERLQPQTLKVLVALLSRRGEVVTRDELIQLCWDGRIVGDDVINRSILLIRHLAERADGFEIETVPRTGYRLIERPAPRRLAGRRWAIAASAAALLAAVAGGLLYRSEHRGERAATLTIALQLFAANPSDADSRKLASATREAVANTLSEGAYAVTAIDAGAKDGRPPPDFLMSGELTTAPDRAVISVRMEETAHHIIVFTHEFEAPRDKAWTLPEQVGAQVASQVSWTAPLIALERRHPSDPAVTRQLFEESVSGLQGAGNLADYENSRRLAMTAPTSPVAQIDLAYNTAFALEQLPRDQRENAVALARRASARAIALAPESGEPYAPWCMLHSELRWIECENRLRKAMRLDPDAPFANSFLASLVLNPVGRNEEALELANFSLAHDPYMPNKIGLKLRMLEVTGRTGEAEQLYRQSSHWWPGEDAITWRRLTGMIERGDFQSAQHFDSQTSGRPQPNPVLSAINHGSLAEVRTACAKAKDFEETVCMLALARRGDADAAFTFADKLYPSRRGGTLEEQDRIWLDDPAPNAVAFLSAPAAASLRRDPRYIALAERVGLLAYWRSGRLPDFCTKAHEPICAILRSK